MKGRVLLAGLWAAILGFLLAAPVTAQETYYGCSKLENGQLRIVSSPDECLSSEIAMLISGGQAGPQEYVVNCNEGETVSAILDNAPRTGPVTIQVQGVCRESVYIDRDDLRIEGTVQGDGFEAPSEDSHVVTVNGARRVELFHLTITGGWQGIWAINSASFRAFNVSISGSANNGLEVSSGASGSLENSTISNCTYGIACTGSLNITNTTVEDIENFGVYGDGFSLGNGTVIQNCGHHGVLGSANICGAVIQNNQGSGVWGGGDIACSETVIRQNNGGGVVVSGDSMGIRDGAQIIENNGNGVAVFGGSVGIEGGIISNNLGEGVVLEGASSGKIAENSIITSNTGSGVFLGDTSVANFVNISGGEISNNGGYGITCLESPSVSQIYIGDTSFVFGNTLGQINCPQN